MKRMKVKKKMTKQIIAIWAEDDNHLIGVDGRLPWRLPKELQHFKETTMGGALLMGRVTFDGMKRRILPGRETLILTKDRDFDAEGIKVVNSLSDVLEWFDNQDKNLYIVGGSSIYKVFEHYYDTIVKTSVHGSFRGDTYFPDIDLSPYEEVSKTFFEKDDENINDFTITVLTKKSR